MNKRDRVNFCDKCICETSSHACQQCNGYSEYIPVEIGVTVEQGQEEVRLYFENEGKPVNPTVKNCSTCAYTKNENDACERCDTNVGYMHWASRSILGQLGDVTIKSCATCIHRLSVHDCADCNDNSKYIVDVKTVNHIRIADTPPLSEMDDLAQTLAKRQDAYGDFLSKCQTIWAIKHAMHATPNWETMPTDMKESLSMVVHKIGRILHGQIDHIDSWHDIQGYAKLIEDRLKKEYR